LTPRGKTWKQWGLCSLSSAPVDWPFTYSSSPGSEAPCRRHPDIGVFMVSQVDISHSPWRFSLRISGKRSHQNTGASNKGIHLLKDIPLTMISQTY